MKSEVLNLAKGSDLLMIALRLESNCALESDVGCYYLLEAVVAAAFCGERHL